MQVITWTRTRSFLHSASQIPLSMEHEVKFQLPYLAEIRKRIIARGGRLIQERTLERNLRFDDPEHTLSSSYEVLRLRQDCEVTLTYKRSVERFESRVEIELTVDDFNNALAFLEALGYSVIHEYEKYSETFTLGSSHIMLDELPFGCYVEIEADSLKAVRQMAVALGFNWEDRVQTTYLDLFYRMQDKFHFEFEDATFAHFEGLGPETRAKISTYLDGYNSHLE
jgi:predicted adenylyl cyclase CyaB